MSPVAALFKSRKFWTGILDLIFSTVLFFTAKYLAPEFADDVKFMIAALQPVFLMIIAGIAWEDAAEKRAGNFIVPPAE